MLWLGGTSLWMRMMSEGEGCGLGCGCGCGCEKVLREMGSW
jgi:hypothetical protein